MMIMIGKKKKFSKVRTDRLEIWTKNRKYRRISNVYIFSAHAGVTLTSIITFGVKRWRAVGEKDVFLRNTKYKFNYSKES